jgi:hypothetical protein
LINKWTQGGKKGLSKKPKKKIGYEVFVKGKKKKTLQTSLLTALFWDKVAITFVNPKP